MIATEFTGASCRCFLVCRQAISWSGFIVFVWSQMNKSRGSMVDMLTDILLAFPVSEAAVSVGMVAPVSLVTPVPVVRVVPLVTTSLKSLNAWLNIRLFGIDSLGVQP